MKLVFKTILSKLIDKQNLKKNEAQFAFKKIMSGNLSDIEISAFLVALASKRPHTNEIIAAVKVLREKSAKINLSKNLLDTCGTGGDGMNTLNISTATALLTAACGIKVAKHGNKSVSSKSGSSDVLEKLGVNINANKNKVEKCFKKVGLCFLMAPLYHSAMKNVANVRAELKIKTIFNILGPLINPAGAKFQLIGVYSKDWLVPIANCLKELSVSKTWIVHGEDGLDEITTTGKTYVIEINRKKIKKFIITPSQYGLKKSKMRNLKGNGASYNAKAIKNLFSNKNVNEDYKNIVLLNTAACLVIVDKCKNIKEGIKLAKHALDSGLAMEKLDQLIKVTQ